MAETLPIKYVKSNDTTFSPVTSFNCVLDESGKNINDIYINKEKFPLDFVYEMYDNALNLISFNEGIYETKSTSNPEEYILFTSNTLGKTILDAGTYCLSFTLEVSGNQWRFNGFIFSNSYNGSSVYRNNFDTEQIVDPSTGAIKNFSFVFTLEEQITFQGILLCKNIGGSCTIKLSNLMVNKGTTPLPYIKYHGGTIAHKKDIEQYFKGKDLSKLWLEKIYPVGSIYLTIEKKSPAAFLGGTWYLIADNRALWTASSDAGNTISAGLPNITGSFGSNQDRPASGAFYVSATGQKNSGIYSYASTVQFNASRSSSIYGASSTVQPPAYKVYAWRRAE